MMASLIPSERGRHLGSRFLVVPKEATHGWNPDLATMSQDEYFIVKVDTIGFDL